MRTQRRAANVQFQRNVPLSVETTPHFWHPQRFGVRKAPTAFIRRLQTEINPDIEVTWWVTGERWLIWQREPTVTHRTCPGWSLKIIWQGHQNRYLPLDERVFANLYARQLWRYPGGGKGYFARIEAEIEREKAVKTKDSKADVDAKVREFSDSRQIKNIGAGNKFALHHDGSIIPSRGELNWRRDLLDARRPS